MVTLHHAEHGDAKGRRAERGDANAAGEKERGEGARAAEMTAASSVTRSGAVMRTQTEAGQGLARKERPPAAFFQS